MRAGFIFGALVIGTFAAFVACGSAGKGSGFTPDSDGGGATDDEAGSTGEAGSLPGGDGGTLSDGGVIVGDPVNCADAKTSKSYVGCDYWPTVTANSVWSIFDFAVVVSNVGTAPASITVTGGALVSDGGVPTITATVAPGALEKIYLPWVPSLKGPDQDECTAPATLSNSVMAEGGAYHLVSSSPVVVYQFNALEYGPTGGPAGKNWATCPGTTTSCDPDAGGGPVGCFSYTNDASLLLPSTAMTLNYRVSGHPAQAGCNTFMAITATADATNVTATLSAAGTVLGASDAGIAATAGGGTLKFTLAHAGDVAEVMGTAGATADFSGSLVQADNPIQVITGTSSVTIPAGQAAADHTEQTVLPAETLGKHYIVPMPDKPGGGLGVGVLRFYGNEDGTTLTYNPATPPSGCPSTLNAGQVAECSIGSVNFFTGSVSSKNVDVSGDKEFGVAVFQEGAGVYGALFGSGASESDPSESVLASVEQFRLKYLFLAPTDYDQSYADIVGTSDSAPVLDGAAVSTAFSAIGSGPYGVWRVTLNAGPKGDGAHSLTSTKPVGLQVIGYGNYTSYQYPGGLNLNQIAPSPPPPR